ncbi:MAG: GHMP kinase [Gemmatimonadetes bacterium]|nr:GHMP kinase [Gemmatimonadota bacterium]
MTPRTLAEVLASPDGAFVAPVLERLRALRDGSDAAVRDFLRGDEPLFVARAPGRLDVMGGIADYSGSLVLQLPLEVATTAIVQPSTERTIELMSLRPRSGRAAHYSVALDALLEGALRDPEKLRARVTARRDDKWAAYVLGVVHACLVRPGAEARASAGGFRMLILSDVPEGKGVSSSAALEVASLAAVAARYGVEMRDEAIAIASQWAENHVAGAPCGIMDQMTSACGHRDRLLRLLCQPDIVEGHVAIPEGWRFYGIDSGIRHAVTGSDYGTVRTAAFMGYRIIAEAAGLPATIDASNVREVDTRWHGYLANITPIELESRFAAHLPEWMTGEEFLARFGGITDVVTRVQPSSRYPVRQATAHPVYEHARVTRFATLLDELGANGAPVAREMGALMGESHASYSACGLGSDGTDRLVELVTRAGPTHGLFGAKITGGGSGGTVAILGRDSAESEIRAIAREYEAETGREAFVFARSGPGLIAATDGRID